MALYICHFGSEEARNASGANAVLVDAADADAALLAAGRALPPGSSTTRAWTARLLSEIVPVVIEGNAIPPGRYRGN